jgi:hypothetical protein
MTNVSQLVAAAFALGRQTHGELNQTWIKVSVRLGGLVPHSRLMMSVQHDGELDLVLRCMEDDLAAAGGAEKIGMFEGHYLVMLSEIWIASVYETLRLLDDRQLMSGEQALSLAEDFRLLRVPLEKHEIASQGQLNAPIQLQKIPPRNDQSDLYVYDKKDPRRAHIMPQGVSDRGSCMWLVTDIKKNQDRWIERRWLSDKIIDIWGRDSVANEEATTSAPTNREPS